MKKRMLGVLVASLCASQAMAETRTLSMGGSGVANGNYIQAGFINPALMARFEDRDNVGLVFPSLAFSASDEDKLIDTIDNFQDSYDRLESLLDSGSTDVNAIEEARNEVKQSFQAIRGDVSFNADIYAQLAIPANLVSIALYIHAQPTVFTGPRLNGDDLDVIANATNSEQLDDLKSAGIAVGSLRTDLGLVLAKNFEIGDNKLAIGVTPKLQRVDTFAYAATIQSFDEDNFDAKDYSTDDNFFNIDVGVTYSVDNWSVGLVGKNLISQSVKSAPFFNLGLLGNVDYSVADLPLVYDFKPEFVAGVGYRSKSFTVSADVDLTAQNYLHMATASQLLLFGEEIKQQFVRAGAEFDLWRTLQLRVGYRHDLKGNFDDAITAGLGFSPFGRLHINLMGSYVSDRNFGAGAQLAFTF